MAEFCSSVTLSRGGAVTSVIDVPEGSDGARAATPGTSPVLVLAHGAGNDLRSGFMEFFASALAGRGLTVVRFNFPYKERGGTRPPDRMDVLADCFRDVLLTQARRTGSPPGPLFLGGKSMGGRVAAALAASGRVRPSGLVFLGFPLHKPGAPENLRTDDLPRVGRPLLFVQGTRDPFGGPDLVRSVVKDLKLRAAVHRVDGGDHSFALPKSRAAEQRGTLDAAADAVAAFVAKVLAAKR